METRIENWCGYDIRFVEINGEWWAILNDIWDALELDDSDVNEMIDKECILLCENEYVLNETGVYEAIFMSDHPRARSTRLWLSKLLQKHRMGCERSDNQ